ncbi:MAG: InlB B-repeat-containing protein [Eubacteriales bacterium]|nr:InlB B-repeat-containing protein [Eubacteriales bacterium]
MLWTKRIIRSLATFLTLAIVLGLANIVNCTQIAYADGELKTFTATIQYQLQSGEAISNPYIATVKDNWGKTVTVPSPEVPGYTADQSTVTLVFDENFKEDQLIIVTYSPNQVSYKIKHMIQNLDDGYSLKSEEEKTGLVDTLSEKPVPLEIPGFTPSFVDVPTMIPAVGSLDLFVRYDRNSYQLSFDSQGGSPVQAQHLYYEEAISPPAAPEKKGFEFAGWEPELPATMPSENLSVSAKWTPSEKASYTLKYWVQNPNKPDEYEYIGSKIDTGAVGTSPSVPASREGLAFPGLSKPESITNDDIFSKFYVLNEGKTNASLLATTIAVDGSTEVDVYYDRVKYKIAFRAMRADVDGTAKIWAPRGGDTLVVNGKTYSYDEPYVIEALFGENLLGKWIWGTKYFPKLRPSENGTPVMFEGWLAKFPKDSPYQWYWYNSVYNTMEKMLITGANWFSNTEKTLYLDPRFEYASERIAELSYHFFFQGLSENQAPEDYIENTDLHVVRRDNVGNDFTYDAFRFVGFTPTQNEFPITDWVDAVMENHKYVKRPTGKVCMYYQRNHYALSFYADSTSSPSTVESVLYEKPLADVLKNVPIPEKPQGLFPEYVFKGWQTRQHTPLASDAKMPAENLDLIAVWGPAKDLLTVSFDPNNGDPITTQSVKFNERITAPAAPIKAGYRFLGWKLKTRSRALVPLYNFSNPVHSDLDLIAVWKKSNLRNLSIRYEYLGADASTHEEIISNLAIDSDYTAEAEASKLAGYFPDATSKSIRIGEDEKDNVIIFTYEKIGEAEYSIRYIEKTADGDKELLPTETGLKTKKAIETVNYKAIKGYTPNQYQITFMLTSDPSQNVVSFLYRKNEDAYYTVEYYFEDEQGNYLLDDTLSEKHSAALGTEVTLSVPESNKEHILNREKSILSGVVSSEGKLILKVYYDLKKPEPSTTSTTSTTTTTTTTTSSTKKTSSSVTKASISSKLTAKPTTTGSKVPATGETDHWQFASVMLLLSLLGYALHKKRNLID